MSSLFNYNHARNMTVLLVINVLLLSACAPSQEKPETGIPLEVTSIHTPSATSSSNSAAITIEPTSTA